MRYFRAGESIFAFNSTQEHLITKEHIELTPNELDRFLNPQNYMSEEEKLAIYRRSLPALTRRQFKLALLKNGMLDQIESAIMIIEDHFIRSVIQIEYNEATEFHRTSESILTMCRMLGLSDTQVDSMWSEALKL